jgi:hypothetical protein
MTKIDETRVKTEEIKDKFPNLYREQVAHDIVETITLFSDRASSQCYRYKNGRTNLCYGSRWLYNRWLMIAE